MLVTRQRGVLVSVLATLGACAPHAVELELDDPLELDEAFGEDAVDLRELDSLDWPDSVEQSGASDEADPGEHESATEAELSDACRAGRDDAATHIAADILMLEVYGYPSSCRASYAHILEDRFGISLNMVSGCVVNDWILDHARCYNETMTAEVARRHGQHALERASEDAGCN
jgi:hypothetical protein